MSKPAPRHRRALAIVGEVMAGVQRDGFIHAGNLAYMAILSLFPFFIVVGAIFSVLGEARERIASVAAFLSAMPPVVAHVLEPVGRAVIGARHGWLMWVSGVVGLWTVSSLIETIRDILRRAYHAPLDETVWLRDRLLSTLMIVLAAILLLGCLYLQVMITTAQEVIRDWFPGLQGEIGPLRLSQSVPMLLLFCSLWQLFYWLAPAQYRRAGFPKWPGALLVTLLWGVVSMVLPVLLRVLLKYDLTYGSLAGAMICLFFFWLVGLGVVTGAELNAALAHSARRR